MIRFYTIKLKMEYEDILKLYKNNTASNKKDITDRPKFNIFRRR